MKRAKEKARIEAATQLKPLAETEIEARLDGLRTKANLKDADISPNLRTRLREMVMESFEREKSELADKLVMNARDRYMMDQIKQLMATKCLGAVFIGGMAHVWPEDVLPERGDDSLWSLANSDPSMHPMSVRLYFERRDVSAAAFKAELEKPNVVEISVTAPTPKTNPQAK